MINIKTKKAFSMITAIFVIIIMATVTSLVMNVTGKTIKATTMQYQKEQAALLARSYTELAILYVIHKDRTSGCIKTIIDHFGDATNGYNIKMNISYIGNSTLLANCNNNIESDGTIHLSNKNATWTTTGGFHDTISLVIDTYITYKDFDDPNTDRNITFHRRTLQKL